MKLGSLFDGSGGFPLAGVLNGITPVWASEVEPYPIAVTRSRFPEMIHLGDISSVDGSAIEPVDVITFGSPCQDMSIAGKRAGIKNQAVGDDETTRSGLFYEAARIIREMKEATNGRYPSFAVWENVPGAFSSNNGEDFRCVLETLIQIVESGAVVPQVPKGGWSYYDCWVGDGWSLAYRTVDAQYWGVPQRRRRIYLVLDLGGNRAGKILFERKGLRGDFEESESQGEGTTSNVASCPGVYDKTACIPINTMIATRWKKLGRGTGFGVGRNGDPQFTISAAHEHAVCAPITMKIQSGCEGEAVSKSSSISSSENISQTPAGGMTSDVVIKCWDARGNGNGETSSTITGDHESRITDYTTVVCLQGNTVDRNAHQNGSGINENISFTLNSTDRHVVVYRSGGFGQYAEDTVSSTLKRRDFKSPTDIVCGVDCRNMAEYSELYPTLQAKPNGGQSLNFSGAVRVFYVVRRLTPIECARLQGFPDHWGDIAPLDISNNDELFLWKGIYKTYCRINGKKVSASILSTPERLSKWHSKLQTDSSMYKMWGNGIALPNAAFVMKGIAKMLRVQLLIEQLTGDSHG